MFKFSILAADNNRSKAYLQNMLREGFYPETVILLDNSKMMLPEKRRSLESLLPDSQKKIRKVGFLSSFYDENEEVKSTVEKYNINCNTVVSDSVNSPQVIEAVKNLETEYIVYSGPGGVILGRDILNAGKKFIHAHPGSLPAYKGSTTFYYSYLLENKIFCSVLFLDKNIDNGPLLYQKEYELSEKNLDFDFVVDPLIRTETLLDFLRKGEIKEARKNGSDNTFFIIHPVLKHLAILKNRKSDL